MNIKTLKEELSAIIGILSGYEKTIDSQITEVHPDYRSSARNLLRYLILRSFDLRKYHSSLSDIGVSSLRTTEAYVLDNLQNVVKNLHLIDGTAYNPPVDIQDITSYTESKKIIRKNANKLFNGKRRIHFTEIMVTLPNEAAEDKEMIREMVEKGMEIARINLSHGNLEIWEKMITFINEVATETGQTVKIYMDLSGPKIRTAAIEIPGKKGKITNKIPIRKGEHIILTSRDTLGKKSDFGEGSEQITKAEVGVLLNEIITDAQIGDFILFDDGMIKAKVIDKNEQELELVIIDAYKNKLGARKGINLPDTKLNLPALTERDIELLPFVCKHADIVGYSFVRTGEDVKKLYAEIEKLGADELGVVFKIENKEAFENLPEILLNGMKRNKIGVMIARGDLAVELGFERISEVQNQILWLCEAAHVPVIWATQVLDNLARTGIPTRAEISDAAQAAQAECVMLNKGPHIASAIEILKDILIRMEGHGFKKKNELRALNVAENFVTRLDALKLVL